MTTDELSPERIARLREFVADWPKKEYGETLDALLAARTRDAEVVEKAVALAKDRQIALDAGDMLYSLEQALYDAVERRDRG